MRLINSFKNKVKLWFQRRKAKKSLKPLEKAKRIRERNEVLKAYDEELKIFQSYVAHVVVITFLISLTILLVWAMIFHFGNFDMLERIIKLLKQV